MKDIMEYYAKKAKELLDGKKPEARIVSKKIYGWTPCEHYDKCIGFCQYCFRELADALILSYEYMAEARVMDCPECAVRWSCSLEADGPDFVPCEKHAGVAQAAEHRTRNAEREVSSTPASPSFEQVSRCCK